MKNLLAMLVVAVASFGVASASLAEEKRDNARGAFSVNVVHNDNRDVDGKLDGKARYSLRGEGDFNFRVAERFDLLLGGEIRFENEVRRDGRLNGELAHTVEEAYVGVGRDDLFVKVGRMDDLWETGLATELSSNAVADPASGEYMTATLGNRMFKMFVGMDKSVTYRYRDGKSMAKEDSVDVDGLRNVQARLDLPRFSGARASLMVDYSLGHVDRESLRTGDGHAYYGDPRYVKDGNVTLASMVDFRTKVLPVGFTTILSHDVDRKRTGWQLGTDWKGLRIFAGGYSDAEDPLTLEEGGRPVESKTEFLSEAGLGYNVAFNDVRFYAESVYDVVEEDVKVASGVKLVF